IITAGTAQCTVQSWALTAGTRTLTAVYSGNYTGSSARLALVVNKAASAVHARGPATVRRGRLATVSASSLPAHATGRVTVSLNGRQLCAGKVSKGAAHCSFRASMKPGRYSFTVHYIGDGNYKGSTAIVRIRVTR
ncbi:MAG TPA: Ig-like domain repeat protein, partial [Jatrophihabitans sp.]|nr:Ig-like domain repeat protein [Jatrophihabitans sp.]